MFGAFKAPNVYDLSNNKYIEFIIKRFYTYILVCFKYVNFYKKMTQRQKYGKVALKNSMC